MTYDPDNELTTVSYSDGVTPNVGLISYDADGQRVGMSDGTGASTWAWDSLHRLTSFTDGHADQVQYQYNLRGLATQITYPGSLNVVRGYDDAGRWTSVQDWLNKTTVFGYDADGNLTTKTLPATSGIVDTSVVNPAEQLSSVSDVKGGSTTLFAATYGRDSNGQVASDSSVPAAVGTDKYTPLNQLCYAGSSAASACSAPPSGSQAYGFDAADNLTKNLATTQAFNAADQLCWTVTGTSSNACATPPSGATTYAYNARGDRTTVTPPSGSATNLGYDQANRLSSWGQGGTTTATYAYNGDGLRMTKTVSGVAAHFIWDVSGQVPLVISDGTSEFVYGPGNLPLEQIQTAAPAAISLVGSGSASGKSTSLSVTLPGGTRANDQVVLASTQPSTTTVTAPAGYTSVTSVTSGGASPLAKTTVFRHTLGSGETSVTLTYSARTTQAVVLAVYRGVDPATPIDAFGSGSAAATTSVTAPSVTPANANDELIVVEGAVGTFSASTWTAAGGTTERVQSNPSNASSGLADQPLGAAGPTGTRTSTFGKTANLTTVMVAVQQPPTVLFLHADQLGSTRMLTDSAGNVRATFTYDPYGSTTASTGSATTPLGYSGEYRDSETGLIYLRARYYDPTTAQMLTRDPMVSVTRSPYGYSMGDPVNRTDPSGLDSAPPSPQPTCESPTGPGCAPPVPGPTNTCQQPGISPGGLYSNGAGGVWIAVDQWCDPATKTIKVYMEDMVTGQGRVIDTHIPCDPNNWRAPRGPDIAPEPDNGPNWALWGLAAVAVGALIIATDGAAAPIILAPAGA